MIELRVPTINDKENATIFLREFIAAASKINGSGGLDSAYTYEGWLKKCEEEKALPYLGYHAVGKVPARTFFGYRLQDNKLIGMVNIRTKLNQYLDEEYLGQIGYCIRPSERQKGYGMEMAKLALDYCKNELKLPFVRLGCYYDNAASRKIIEKLGGKLISESPDHFMVKGVYYEITL